MKFQIREGRFQGVGKCLIREYRMVCHVLKREISKDFVEVLSAFLIVYLRSETIFIHNNVSNYAGLQGRGDRQR